MKPRYRIKMVGVCCKSIKKTANESWLLRIMVCFCILNFCWSTLSPTLKPTIVPTMLPTIQPSLVPSVNPSAVPTVVPTLNPTMLPTTRAPTLVPTTWFPTNLPTIIPSTVVPTSVRSTQNLIYTVAGSGGAGLSGGTGGYVTAATFYSIRSVWATTDGEVYIAESDGNCVRYFLQSNQILLNYAGTCGIPGGTGDGGPATAATLNSLVAIQMDTTGVLVITDTQNNKIRKVSGGGIISTFVGTGSASNTGDGSPGTSATLWHPNGLFILTTGYMYVTSNNGNLLRKVDSAGIISLVAGCSTSALFGGDGGPATAAYLNGPQRVYVDSTGLIYLADSANNRLRTIASNSIISTLVGNGANTYVAENLPGTSCPLSTTAGIAVDPSNGDVYIGNKGLRRLSVLTDATGLVSTYAGTGTSGYSGDGGPPTSAQFSGSPDDLFMDSDGLLYVADTNNYRVRGIYSTAPSASPSKGPTQGPTSTRSTQNNIYNSIGTGAASSAGNGLVPTSASINQPKSVIAVNDYLYTVENGAHCVRQSQAIIAALAGVCGTPGNTGDLGRGTSAKFNNIISIAIQNNVVYVADSSNAKIRTISLLNSNNIVATFAGSGVQGNTGNGGKATAATLTNPYGVWVSSTGILYIVDYIGYVRMVDSSSTISLVSGTGTSGFSGDSFTATSATFSSPERIFVDTAGVLYISDTINRRIRTIEGGIISTLIGMSGCSLYADGAALTSTCLTAPTQVAVDSFNGDVYVPIRDSYRVVVASMVSGIVTTHAGSGVSGYSGDGGPATAAAMSIVEGAFLRTDGRLYISDSGANHIRMIYSVAPSAAPTTFAPTRPTLSPTSAAPSSTRSSQNNIYTAMGTGVSGTSGTGGPATAAKVSSPRGVFEDSSGVFYVVDATSNCIRKFSLSVNIVMAYAGSCGSGSAHSGDGGAASNALMTTPVGITSDSAGNIYFTELANYIRKISPSDIVSALAGTGTCTSSIVVTQATSAGLCSPTGIAFDTNGFMYFSNYGSYQIGMISTGGIVVAFAGSGYGYSGDGASATAAKLTSCEGVFLDSSGVFYTSDSGNSRVRSVESGIIATVAGSSSTTYTSEGLAATNCAIGYPVGMWVDPDNNDLYVTTRGMQRVMVVSGSSGLTYTFAGGGSHGEDGIAATSASLINPDGMYVDTNGNMFVGADNYGKVRQIYSVTPSMFPSCVPSMVPTTSVPTVVRSASNIITTFAGTGASTSSGFGAPATSAAFYFTVSVFSVGSYFYIVEYNSYCVRYFDTSSYIVQRYAGTCGFTGSTGDGGPATQAKLTVPRDIYVDSTYTSYIADFGAYMVKKVPTSAIISTAGGKATGSNSGDGGPWSAAVINTPFGIWGTSSGKLFIACYTGNVIRKVDLASGIITTVAGIGTSGTGADNVPATSSALNNPQRVITDTTGLVYISSSGNHRVRMINSLNIIATVAGLGSTAYSGENVAATSSNINAPTGLAVDSSNSDLYISAYGTHRIQVVTKTTGLVNTFAGTGTMSTIATAANGDGASATSATLSYPDGLILETVAGKLYISDSNNNKVRKTYSNAPTSAPSVKPSTLPSLTPSLYPSFVPSWSFIPTLNPTIGPSFSPTIRPTTWVPTTNRPSMVPTIKPSISSSPTAPTLSPTSTAPTPTRDSRWSIDTIAGNGGLGSSGTGGKATSATLFNPRSVWEDSVGTMYITETDGNCVRKFPIASGIVANQAGVCNSQGQYSGANVQATAALLNYPLAFVTDSAGNMFVSDEFNHRVRAIIGSTGIIYTVVGTGTGTNSGDNGPPTAASISFPSGIWLNSLSELYVICSGFIRKVGSTRIEAFAGSSTGVYDDYVPATSAQFNGPERIFGDSTGQIYVSDSSNLAVRVISSAGIIKTIIGDGLGDTFYNLAGTATSINYPTGIVVDPFNGNVFVACRDSNIIILLSPSTGVVTAVAGSLTFQGDSGDKGPATAALLTFPDGLFLDISGNLVIGHYNYYKVRWIYSTAPTFSPTQLPTIVPTSLKPTVSPSFSPTQVPTYSQIPTVVPTSASPTTSPTTSAPSTYRTSQYNIDTLAGTGNGDSTGTGGRATSASFITPYSVDQDTIGRTYVVESIGACVRRFPMSTMIVSAYAGICNFYGMSGEGVKASNALLNAPYDIVTDTIGGAYIADLGNNRIRYVNQFTNIATFAGTGADGYSGDDGPATSAVIPGPLGIFLNSIGDLYMACSSFVRKVSQSGGIITLVAGTASGFSGDGFPATTTQFDTPQRVTGDTTGNFYIAESGSNLVRGLDSSSIVHTLIGSLDVVSLRFGIAATSFGIQYPTGMVIDGNNGNFFVSSQNTNQVVYLEGSSGLIALAAGLSTGIQGSSGDGGPATLAQINAPDGICLDTLSNLYIGFIGDNRIRWVYSTSPTLSPTFQPTIVPTNSPTRIPSFCPSNGPSLIPSLLPSKPPSVSPSLIPSTLPTVGPSITPSMCPSVGPTTFKPSILPSVLPSVNPSMVPTTIIPSCLPTMVPSIAPSIIPTIAPSVLPSVCPSKIPTLLPTVFPTVVPSNYPSMIPTTASPTLLPSVLPTTSSPSFRPTCTPTRLPTVLPTDVPNLCPTVYPTSAFPSTQMPSFTPSLSPSNLPTQFPIIPSVSPSCIPSGTPSVSPSGFPSVSPSVISTLSPSLLPSNTPSVVPTISPSCCPTLGPSIVPSTSVPSLIPTILPSISLSVVPSCGPSISPSLTPSVGPSMTPTLVPAVTVFPTVVSSSTCPSIIPSTNPSCFPVTILPSIPSVGQTNCPSCGPSVVPTTPSFAPTIVPTTLIPTISPSSVIPSIAPSILTLNPSIGPTVTPTLLPSVGPSLLPTHVPAVTLYPSISPAIFPSAGPSLTISPTCGPTFSPSIVPSCVPATAPVLPSLTPILSPASDLPSMGPSLGPTICPTLTAVTAQPTATPSVVPTVLPVISSTLLPSCLPTIVSSLAPSAGPSMVPTLIPAITLYPTVVPSFEPTPGPTVVSTMSPSGGPTAIPSSILSSSLPTPSPTQLPFQTASPTVVPSMVPLNIPSELPIQLPTQIPAITLYPSQIPIVVPSTVPTSLISLSPSSIGLSSFPTPSPSESPLQIPSLQPSPACPSTLPSVNPSAVPTSLSPFLVPSTCEPTVVPSTATVSVSPTLSTPSTPFGIDAFAGDGSSTFQGDNGKATSAGFNRIYGIFQDTLGVTYVADSKNNRVRKVDVNGIVTTYAGSGIAATTGSGGTLTSADLNCPVDIWIDSLGSVYIVEFSSYSVRVVRNDIISPFAGTGVRSTLSTAANGDGDAATSASLGDPYDAVGDTVGKLYLACSFNARIRVVSSSGIITSIAGKSGSKGFAGDGGPATAAVLQTPKGIFVDSTGVLFISDSDNFRVRMVSVLDATITTIAGTGEYSYNGNDIAATSASVGYPIGVWRSSLGALYLVDNYALEVRSLSLSDGIIRGIAGGGSTVGSVGDGGYATAASFASPYYLYGSSSSVLYVTDYSANVVRVLTPMVPSLQPSMSPTPLPSILPSIATKSPTPGPSMQPSILPTIAPSSLPTVEPSFYPTIIPTVNPSASPSLIPSEKPSTGPSLVPSTSPTARPFTCGPTSSLPSIPPSINPTTTPTDAPTVEPSVGPSVSPSIRPSGQPSIGPTMVPSVGPSANPSLVPSISPTSGKPSITVVPTAPTLDPSFDPTVIPSIKPSRSPTLKPSVKPTRYPTVGPSMAPTVEPSVKPSLLPTLTPSLLPSEMPSVLPTIALPTISAYPSVNPTISSCPSMMPSILPSNAPSAMPSVVPTTTKPTFTPSYSPTAKPSAVPSMLPTVVPTTTKPTIKPTTFDYYLTHPKATLPSLHAISVVGPSNHSFKIVLPFMQVTLTSSSNAFSDIVLPSHGITGVANVFAGSHVSQFIDRSAYTQFTNSLSLDDAQRSVSVLLDCNGDGFEDLIIGDPYNAKAYVMLGSEQGYTNMSVGFTIFGEVNSDLTGWSVSGAGDVNNDTLADIIVGAPFANGVGAFYVIYGRRFNNFDVYLGNLTDSQGFVVYGAQKTDCLGLSVSSAGDVNKDGFDDVVIGAMFTANYASGGAYILLGGTSLHSLRSIASMSSYQGFKFVGSSFSFAGYSVSDAGDINSDGYDDVILGSFPQRAGIDTTAYLILGGPIMSDMALSDCLTFSGAGSIVGRLNNGGDGGILVESEFQFSSQFGFVVYTNTADLVPMTAAPTVMPTRAPTVSRRPTYSPTLKPTQIPSVMPSVLPSIVPTAPTFSPSMGDTEPTHEPSERPSGPSPDPSFTPSKAPIEPTVVPSLEPSEHPTVEPSESPSEHPSATPSEMPTLGPIVRKSVAPTIPQTQSPTLESRAPFAAPSMLPTVVTTMAPVASYYVTGHNIVVNDTAQASAPGKLHYIVNATGNVQMVGHGGQKIYTIVPGMNLTLTIWSFNQSTDVIDLTLYRESLQTFTDLGITRGSVIVTLPTNQVIHILNLEPSDVSAANFWFADAKNKSGGVSTKVIAIASVVVALSVIVIAAFYFYRLSVLSKGKVTDSIVKREFLMVLVTNLNNELLFNDDVVAAEDHRYSLMESNASRWNLSNVSSNSIPSPDLSYRTISSEGELIARSTSKQQVDPMKSLHGVYPDDYGSDDDSSGQSSMPGSVLFSISSGADDKMPAISAVQRSESNNSIAFSDFSVNSDGQMYKV